MYTETKQKNYTIIYNLTENIKFNHQPFLLVQSASIDDKLDDLESIYISLNTSGYNLFNLNDSFYTDICSTYTTQKGTDISMADRKNIIYDNYKNATLCQSGCSFLYYDYTNKKSECQCNAQTEETITNIETLSFNKEEFIDNFYKTLKNSNFLVMKCYELIFSLEGIINNYGSYLMSIMTFIFFYIFFLLLYKRSKIY